jgi:predicted GH43/DUF377 family glycosyl hydrolase
MKPMPTITHLPIVLRPDATRVVLRPFTPADEANAASSRAQALANSVLALPPAELEAELTRVLASLAPRHRHARAVLLRRFHDVYGQLIGPQPISTNQSLLIGAYFCKEYSFEATALFNPSVVPHPNQNGLAPGDLRFILSLRGVGEGHVSSITFRTGTLGADGTVAMAPASAQAISPRIEPIPDGTPTDPGARLFCEEAQDMSEIVIFPITLPQRHGIEDLRLLRFASDDGHATFFGTYTAFSGQDIRSELLRTTDFVTFEMNALRGPAATGKGLALFPRRVDGRYAMLARLDHENIWLLQSCDLYQWDAGVPILRPAHVWEFIQMGNCGSPIEIAEGWLLLVHGVGPVRNYCIGAALLDKANPAHVLARLAQPLLRPGQMAREGYVPNVIYSCGALVHGRLLMLPYGVADSFTTIATLRIDDLLAAMEWYPQG